MNVKRSLTGLFMLVSAALMAETMPLEYTYLDESFKPVSPEGTKFSGADLKILHDGFGNTQAGVLSPFAVNQKKVLTVQFKFPFAVTAASVSSTWCWPFNQPKSWIDKVEVFAGNMPGEFTLAGELVPANIPPMNHYTLNIPLKNPVTAKYFTVRITQEADPVHEWFAVDEISFEITDEDQRKLERQPDAARPLKFLRRYPCSVYEPGEPINLEFAASCTWREPVHFTLKDFYGNVLADQDTPVSVLGWNDIFTIRQKPLPEGYYEGSIYHKEGGIDEKFSFIVQPVTNRTGKEAVEAGCRFGVQGGFNTPEGTEAFCKLGMPWRRDLYFYAPSAGNDPENPNWSALNINKNPKVLQIYEVKTVPNWCVGKADTTRPDQNPCMTVPSDGKAFARFIGQQLSFLPGKGGIYEEWNEPWFSVSGTDFAKITGMMTPAMKETKPECLLGADLGEGDYLAEWIRAGGMKGHDFLTIHPYCRYSPEKGKLRERILTSHAIMKREYGRDLPIIITEIGWPTSVGRSTEYEQAAYLARAAMILYAEDVKVITPYCMGQPETNPQEPEDFFGLIRKNLCPKPALASYAATARILEGSQYLGDLNAGKNVYSMLFRLKDGRLAAAVYADGKTVPFKLNVHSEKSQFQKFWLLIVDCLFFRVSKPF